MRAPAFETEHRPLPSEEGTDKKIDDFCLSTRCILGDIRLWAVDTTTFSCLACTSPEVTQGIGPSSAPSGLITECIN